ncbi:hypothetical protein K440DRAFT_646006 [Wilcoxina mikolae CBS 423.85]|nr:hypothetical protein K440DRAFT_646006 [Wilcoxina mikolae CBS 423.85]
MDLLPLLPLFLSLSSSPHDPPSIGDPIPGADEQISKLTKSTYAYDKKDATAARVFYLFLMIIGGQKYLTRNTNPSFGHLHVAHPGRTWELWPLLRRFSAPHEDRFQHFDIGHEIMPQSISQGETLLSHPVRLHQQQPIRVDRL